MVDVLLCSDCAEARKSVESVKCLPGGILHAPAEGFKGHMQFQVHLPTVFFFFFSLISRSLSPSVFLSLSFSLHLFDCFYGCFFNYGHLALWIFSK